MLRNSVVQAPNSNTTNKIKTMLTENHLQTLAKIPGLEKLTLNEICGKTGIKGNTSNKDTQISLATGQTSEFSARLIMLFKTEDNAFVLCEEMEIQGNPQRNTQVGANQINPYMQGNLIFSNDYPSFKQFQIDALKQKFYFNDTIQDGMPGFKSQKIIGKIINLLEAGVMEKNVCLEQSNGSPAFQITAIKIITCKEASLKSITGALHKLAELNGMHSKYQFVAIDSVLWQEKQAELGNQNVYTSAISRLDQEGAFTVVPANLMKPQINPSALRCS
jgi:hypothetical protein